MGGSHACMQRWRQRSPPLPQCLRTLLLQAEQQEGAEPQQRMMLIQVIRV